MEKSEIKGFIAKRCAKELKDGDVVNLGIGLPTLIPHYLPEGVELIIHAELGIVSAGATPKEGDANYDPYHVIDAGGGVASVAYGGGFIDSATNFGLIRGGHVDACFLGALEVDAQGNLANWIIPARRCPAWAALWTCAWVLSTASSAWSTPPRATPRSSRSAVCR